MDVRIHTKSGRRCPVTAEIVDLDLYSSRGLAKGVVPSIAGVTLRVQGREVSMCYYLGNGARRRKGWRHGRGNGAED